MKKLFIIVALMLSSYSFSQANNHISIDKLSFTLTNFEISGDFGSIPTMNWKTNLTINGFEMQIDERDFQEFSRQINNDDKIVIDQFKATISMIDNELKISNTRFSSPFLKADIKADLLIDINNPEDTWLKSSTVKLDVLSSTLERLVFELERELGEEFPRRGKSIVLEAYGSLKDPRVKGMALVNNPYLSSIQKAEEAAEDAVISSIRAGLENHATEKLMENGRRSWPDNPWDALATTPVGYATTDADAANDGQWRFTTGTQNITHMRGNGDIFHWDYTKGTNTGGNADAVGSMGSREEGVGN
jgi:hypothetical protein